jgi:hypothetical protein
MATPRKVTVDLYSAANPPVLLDTDIPLTAGYWSEDDSDAGAAEVTVPEIGYAGKDLCIEGRLLRFNVAGAADRTALVERVRVVVKANDRSALLRTLQGRDWISEFDDALVDPPLGVASVPSVATVRFDWTHPDLDRTGWVTPTFTGSVYKGDAGPLPGGSATPAAQQSKQGQAPRGWPDPFTGWIWSSATSGPPNYTHPIGTSYFYLPLQFVASGSFSRGTNCKANTPFIPVFTGDDYAQLAFDGALLDEGVQFPTIQWQRCVASGLPNVSAGTHHIAIKCENAAQYGATFNVGSIALCAFQPLTSTGFDYVNNVVIRTGLNVGTSDLTQGGGPWKALDNPANPPGFTVGKAFRILLQKAQAQGALPGWTLGFTDANDSRGNAWPVTDGLTANVNETLLSVIKKWHDEGYWDVAARASSRTLDAWRWQERGNFYTNPASPLSWDDDNVAGLTVEGRR